jgi:uncharacterized protein
MASTVYYGSPRQARWEADETLPAKLDRIIDRLNIRDRVKDEMVAIKMHTGNNIGYSTLHPVFVRKVVKAVLDGGGHPFITDVGWDVAGAETRGYTQEVLGCPIYPSAGIKDRYHYVHAHPYKNIQEWHVAGMIEDATFMINFAHVKGHPSCGFGGLFKNLALGCMTGTTRSQMHDVNHFIPYWFRELCPDRATFERILASCPQQALVEDKHNPGDIHLHYEQCNQCGRCLKVAPEGSLKLLPENFHAFQEACAISASLSLSTFEPGKTTNIALATQITPLCDCFGFTSMPILPDAGIFGSDDIVAGEVAVLDMIAKTPLIEENMPSCMEVHTREGHPFAWLHGPLKDPYLVTVYGEQLGLGSHEYEMVDVYPVEKVFSAGMQYISAK